MTALDDDIASLAERLLPTKRNARLESLRQDLLRRQQEARREGTLGSGFYALAQKEACLHEVNDRLDALWGAYRRVMTDFRLPWDDRLRDDVLARIRQDLEQDIAYIEEMARNVIVQHGHSFDLFLRDAWPGMLDRLTAEVDLFGKRQRPTSTPLALQLGAPRYAGPAEHWRRAEAFRCSDPPDLLSAARESIHAVEALAKLLTGDASATLGECVKTLRNQGLPGTVAKQLEALWGHASNLAGVRHGSHSGELPHDAELLFVIETSEAAARLLLHRDRVST